MVELGGFKETRIEEIIMNVPKVSVIVPVYKVEKYLHRCVDSILNQTFTDFELILVDDGSPDNCGAICDEYAAKDSRVRVIHKENGGVSSARNVGLDVAQGKYVSFCDADDFFLRDSLKNLVQESTVADSQLIVGGIEYWLINEDNNEIQYRKSIFRQSRDIQVANTNELWLFWTENNMLSACGKLFITNKIRKNNLKFNEKLIAMEDCAFVLDYLRHCNNIAMSSSFTYVYCTHLESSLKERRARLDYFDDVVCVSGQLSDFLNSIGCVDQEHFQNKTIYFTLMQAYNMLWNMDTNGLCHRIQKYTRIKKAISVPIFKNLIEMNKHNFSVFEYFFLRYNCILGMLALRVCRNFL